MMAAIIEEAEAHITEWGRWHGMTESTSDDSVALARAARELAQDRDVSAIALFTHTGRNAIIMSKARPRVPILAFTPDPRTYLRLSILWNVTPYLIPQAESVEAMLAHVEAPVNKSSSSPDCPPPRCFPPISFCCIRWALPTDRVSNGWGAASR
jgi:pyruvate kinase